MELDDICSRAAELFPLAVRHAIANPKEENPSFDELHQLCAENYERLGFRCHHDFFCEVVPKLEGQLSLDAWCRADLMISGWQVQVLMRPYHLGAGYAHFEIRHDGPLPGVTDTGYRSHFTPLATFAEFTPEEFLALLIPERPKIQQLTLF